MPGTGLLWLSLVLSLAPTFPSGGTPISLMGTTVAHPNQQEQTARPSLWHFLQTMPLFMAYLVPDYARHSRSLGCDTIGCLRRVSPVAQRPRECPLIARRSGSIVRSSLLAYSSRARSLNGSLIESRIIANTLSSRSCDAISEFGQRVIPALAKCIGNSCLPLDKQPLLKPVPSGFALRLFVLALIAEAGASAEAAFDQRREELHPSGVFCSASIHSRRVCTLSKSSFGTMAGAWMPVRITG
jgi:hypothetical protein